MIFRTLVFIAASAYLVSATAQNQPDSESTCPPGWEMTDKQLQGEWRGSIPSLNDSVHLVLGPHPEWKGTVKGTIERDGSTHPMVGDLNNGTVTLEESADGTRITGTWLGEVIPSSCGREIRGNFQASEEAPAQEFMLRKQP